MLTLYLYLNCLGVRQLNCFICSIATPFSNSSCTQTSFQSLYPPSSFLQIGYSIISLIFKPKKSIPCMSSEQCCYLHSELFKISMYNCYVIHRYTSHSISVSSSLTPLPSLKWICSQSKQMQKIFSLISQILL